MKSEVAPEVLAVIERYRLDNEKESIYKVLDQLGVDTHDKIFDYVWEPSIGAPIFTIWAEEVGVHPLNGRMFSVESLAERRTLDGGALMNPAQLDRTNERRRLMGTVLDGRNFIAVLQINEKSIAQLMANEISKPMHRIKDSPWHVERWDPERQRAVLVRGEHGWAPSDAEIEQFLAHGRIVNPDGPAEPGQPVDGVEGSQGLQLKFPDQAHRDLVEARSMEKMMSVFIDAGLDPRDVSRENLGYDIDVLDAAGASVRHVEVKGTASDAPGYFLTRNERSKAASDPLWELAVVTDALGESLVERYEPWEMEKLFSFEPLVWRCDLKKR